MNWNANRIANPLKVSKQIFEVADNVIPTESDIEQIDEHSIALLMSHEYQTDKLNLLKVQKHNLQYIGILRPNKRSTQLIQ